MRFQGEEGKAREPAGPERREPLLVQIRQSRDGHVLEMHPVSTGQRAAQTGELLEARGVPRGDHLAIVEIGRWAREAVAHRDDESPETVKRHALW